MKVDVIVTSATDDDSKFRSRSTDESKTRLVRRSRLAEQIEAEEVLLSNDIETRLQDGGDWYRGKKGDGDVPPASKRSQRGASSSSSDDQFDWASASDDDTGPGIDVPRIAVNVNTSAPGGFFVRPAGSSTPSSPPADDPDKNLDATAMETDISSFFPAAAKTKTKTKTVGDLVCPRKEGLSPRQRLLQRYQMEEMMTLMNESNVDVDRGELPDGSDASGGFRDVESDFVVDRPDSPYSSSRSVGTDAVDGNPGQNHHHPTDGLIRDCHICGYPPCSRADYDLHMKNVHFTHKCHLCVYWSRSPGRLARHLKDFHGEPTDTAVANRKPKNPRKYTCKHCDFYTYVQEEIWKHTRAHVPAAKLLSCPHCPFVCAFKHHMQYHMNNHLGHKPFKCGECNYRCNNKSMLNSHKKSHSNDYPYRCGVCNYAAKYRHALNIHLRKKKHLADGEVVLEEGLRHRGGGRSRHREVGVGVGGGDLVSRNTDSGNPVSVGRVPPSFLPEQMWRQGSARIGNVADYCRVKQEPDGESGPVGVAYPHAGVYAGLSGSSPQPPLISISDLSRNAEELLQRYSPVVTSARTAVVVQTRLAPPMSGRAVQPHSSSSISLVKPAASTSLAPAQSRHHHQQHQQLQEQHHHHSSIYDITNQSRRCLLPPGRPFPPADNSYRTPPYIGLQEQCYSRRNSEEEWPLDLTAKPPNPGRTEPHHHQNHHRTSPLGSGTESPRLDWYECQHCGIIFPDRVLYTMHMEYHGPSDPFRCGLCGQRTQDRREFFNHISQFAHN